MQDTSIASFACAGAAGLERRSRSDAACDMHWCAHAAPASTAPTSCLEQIALEASVIARPADAKRPAAESALAAMHSQGEAAQLLLTSPSCQCLLLHRLHSIFGSRPKQLIASQHVSLQAAKQSGSDAPQPAQHFSKRVGCVDCSIRTHLASHI